MLKSVFTDSESLSVRNNKLTKVTCPYEIDQWGPPNSVAVLGR